MKKKDRERFVKQATQLLLSLGAAHEEDGAYSFTLETKAGLLRLQVTENTTSGPGTVFTRFDDPEAARELVDCNPASGKWNHFFFDGTVETAIESLSFWLKIIMPEQSPNDGCAGTT
jgi:hypothetical protein